jgi:alkylation response protein AidB-like acyl-CoA dehydrogenase
MFTLSEEHKMIRDAARDFAQNEIVPIAAEFDESGEFPHATIRKMGEMGFMGIEIPEEYGGAGMDRLWEGNWCLFTDRTAKRVRCGDDEKPRYA